MNEWIRKWMNKWTSQRMNEWILDECIKVVESHLPWFALWLWRCHVTSPSPFSNLIKWGSRLMEGSEVSKGKFPKDLAHTLLLVKRKVLSAPHYNKMLPKKFARIWVGNMAPFSKDDGNDSKLITELHVPRVTSPGPHLCCVLFLATSWGRQDLFRWPGIKHVPPAMEAWDLNHRATRQVPRWHF